MFGQGIQQQARQIAEKIVKPLAAVGLTPNMATLLGLVLNIFAAGVLATGHLRWGGVLLLFAGIFDMFDGALARVRSQSTVFGAFFDSTLDRYSEGIVLLGLILFALGQPASPARTWVVALAYIAGLGSLMVSYTRARAEGLGLGLRVKSGLMARPERVIVLSAGLILGGAGWLIWTLLILAVTSVVTSLQRIFVVWRALAHGPVPTTAAAAQVGSAPQQPASAAAASTHDDADARRNGRDGRPTVPGSAERQARHPDSSAETIWPEQSAKH